MKKTEQQKRDDHNKAIVEALKNGTELPKRGSVEDMWFPVRPVIKKSQKDLEKLYGVSVGQKEKE